MSELYYMKNSIKVSGSVVFVILIAFSTYHFFISKIESRERQVASFGERNSIQQIKWEQNLAKDIASQDTNAKIPVTVSWQDTFVYEYLKGQYTVSMNQGNIQSVKLQGQKTGLALDVSKFMNQYARNMKNFAKYEIKNVGPSSEKVELKDQKGQSAGSFLFNKNDQGLVTEIIVE